MEEEIIGIENIKKSKKGVAGTIAVVVIIIISMALSIYFKDKSNSRSIAGTLAGITAYSLYYIVGFIKNKNWKVLILNSLAIILMSIISFNLVQENKEIVMIYMTVWLYFLIAPANIVRGIINKTIDKLIVNIFFMAAFIITHIFFMFNTKKDYVIFSCIVITGAVISIFIYSIITAIIYKEKRKYKIIIMIFSIIIGIGTLVFSIKYDFSKNGLSEMALFASDETIVYAGGSFGMIEGNNLEKQYRFREGMAVVKVSGKYGYINKKGEIIIKPIFTEAGDFKNGRGEISINEKTGYIDKYGNIAWYEGE